MTDSSKQARQKRLAVLRQNREVKERVRKQEEKRAAENALQRAKTRTKILNYHSGNLIQHIAQARYGSQGPLASLPIGSIINLARFFKLSEWQAIEQDPVLFNSAIAYLQETRVELGNSLDKDYCDWIPFWRTVQRSNPDWGRSVLLEITLALWGDDVDLMSSAMNSSRQAPSIPSQLGAESGVTNQPPDGPSKADTEEHPVRKSWQTTMLHRSEVPVLTERPTSRLCRSCAGNQETTIRNTADRKMSQILSLLRGSSTNQTRLRDFDGEFVDNLYNIITLGSSASGLKLCHLDHVFACLRHLVESSEGYLLERELNLERTTCLSMDLRVTGDCTIKLKVPRFDGVMLAQDYSLPQRCL